ncbi:hypothetical protein CMQ_7720 [Grosmannia clavigera kw1407]|uniref:Uncharacterized protein n=1 Tax=Grosmannia clavigera (strain kw1407 / UAMH 11150) TaxID=655863 RepID=F0XQ34_GROCL|nr:uncharacterized protein CMQ_7720 [Grosmannia clavigera kw1407]EFX00718.1 hypothetical protein CMQ_7720 [Grosmannia clavigera kw1407]
MPGPKKAKKDARETGGVVAAVTKHATGKFTNGNGQGFASDTSNSSGPSPDLQAVASSSSNGSSSVSPMLEAVSSPAVVPTFNPAPRAIPARVDWQTRANGGSIQPSIAGSPGNLISLMGDSPPSRWSSPRPYGTSHTSHTSQTSHMSHMSHLSHASYVSQATHPTSVSVSPPSGGMDIAGRPGRRPLSYHMDTRRSSLHSHLAQSRATATLAAASAGLSSNPPLPHQPQAHFYGVPDIDLDLQPHQAGIKPGQRGYHFSFDSLPSAYPGRQASLGTGTVVTAGFEGGLRVSLVSKRGLEPLATLSGLRGGVYGAKILPWMAPGTAAEDLFPLVAVVVHGPVLPEALYPEGEGDGDSGVGVGLTDGGAGAVAASASAADGIETDARVDSEKRRCIEYYQTSVEVYSLRHSQWICTLLEAPKIPLAIPVTSPVFQPPPPTGAFQIKADGGTVAVSSATTGECWVFRQMAAGSEDVLPFCCVAKLWTTLQQSPRGSKGSSEATPETERVRAASSAASSQTPSRHSPKQAVLSLSGRWLAYCPANPSSQIALRAVVPVALHGRAPGITSLTPPQLPPTTAEVDLPQSESVMNKIMRDATQEIISGAKWVGQQGWQAFNNYWKGTPGLSTAQSARSDAAQFPPTHGAVTQSAVSKEPGLVSVVDVTALGGSATVHPLATFSPPLGCSFLSFSPSGLWLFTASTKGDVQTVWDLMRVQHTKASPLQVLGGPGGPGTLTGSRVRQIAQFSRMTVARIVDVAWTKPNGERLAMVTERGTVHILDLPSSAFTWPPPRRRTNSTAPDTSTTTGNNSGISGIGSIGSMGGGNAGSGGADTSTGRPASMVAVSYASSALSTAFDAARPLLARPRRSSANVPQSTGATIVDHASHGGKMLAAGISHSLGKTGNAINQLRHNGENRVSLPAGSFAPGPACVVWLTGKRSHALFVLGDGLVRSFASRSRRKTSGQRTLHLSLNKDFRLPFLPDDMLAAAIKRLLEPDEYLDFEHGDGEAGSNTMVLLDSRQRLTMLESSIPQAEIESSAPYQPFHTDRRVALYEFEDGAHVHAAAAAAAAAAVVVPVSRSATPVSVTEPTEAGVVDEDGSVSQSQPSTRKKPKKTARIAAAIEAFRAQEAAVSPTVPTAWAFGQPIASTLVDTGYAGLAEESLFSIGFEETRALPASAMERVLQHDGENEQIVVTTRRRRGGGRLAADDGDDDGFFEDDCEVLDFADQRV